MMQNNRNDAIHSLKQTTPRMTMKQYDEAGRRHTQKALEDLRRTMLKTPTVLSKLADQSRMSRFLSGGSHLYTKPTPQFKTSSPTSSTTTTPLSVEVIEKIFILYIVALLGLFAVSQATSISTSSAFKIVNAMLFFSLLLVASLSLSARLVKQLILVMFELSGLQAIVDAVYDVFKGKALVTLAHLFNPSLPLLLYIISVQQSPMTAVRR